MFTKISFAIGFLLLLGCGGGDPTTAQPDQTPVPTSTPTGTGIVAVQLEQIEGFFVEGFEIGLRFETSDGTVIASTLWTDFVESQGPASIDDFYNSILEQPTPSGDITVRATVNIGAGPPPEVPDLAGPFDCDLVVSVPVDGRVAIQVSFDGEPGCLTRL